MGGELHFWKGTNIIHFMNSKCYHNNIIKYVEVRDTKDVLFDLKIKNFKICNIAFDLLYYFLKLNESYSDLAGSTAVKLICLLESYTSY